MAECDACSVPGGCDDRAYEAGSHRFGFGCSAAGVDDDGYPVGCSDLMAPGEPL